MSDLRLENIDRGHGRQSVWKSGGMISYKKEQIAAWAAMRARSARLTAWGPGARLRAPGGVQGQSPGGGPGGEAPGSSEVLANLLVKN